MNKKNSSAILKNQFKDYTELSKIYSAFSKKIKNLKKKFFLVAVSGGADSLALTALIKSYSYKNKCKVSYVLIDHNLRKNSATEAKSVKRLLKKFQINLNIIKNNRIIKKNIQSEARRIRYNLLSSFCKKRKIKVILTAHNLEDQVETFFIRLSRGSGIQGLSSMMQSNKIENNITLSRPLLEVKKEKLIKISKLIFNKFYKDPSNNNVKYLRTRVRKLKKSIESSGINYDQIFQSIKNLASSRDTLNLYFEKIYKDTVKFDKNKILINCNEFDKLNLEMKIRIIKNSIKNFTKSYYMPRSKKIINLIDNIEQKNSKKFTLGGCIIIKEKKHIILEKEIKT